MHSTPIGTRGDRAIVLQIRREGQRGKTGALYPVQQYRNVGAGCRAPQCREHLAPRGDSRLSGNLSPRAERASANEVRSVPGEREDLPALQLLRRWTRPFFATNVQISSGPIVS
jgi:hypothetical protein